MRNADMQRYGSIRAALVFVLAVLALAPPRPAAAISVDLAKKCRDMAVKAHPPAPAGTSPYAQAEREFFSKCIKNNGEMPNAGATEIPPAAPK